MRWLPPSGARAELEAFDPRPGGAFRMTLVFAADATHGKTSNNTDTVAGTFVDLVAPCSIVQRFEFASDDPKFAGTMTMTWTLEETADGTRVDVAATDVSEGITPAEHAQGMNSSLTNLAAYVEAAAVG